MKKILKANYPKICLKHPCLLKLTTEHIQVIKTMVDLGKAATIDAWVETVVKISKELYWPEMEPEEHLVFKGDALELLTEYLMKTNWLSNIQGCSNYEIIPLSKDYGVDAVGIKNDTRIVIQCKFKHNPLMTIRYSDLARTFTQGVLKYDLDPRAERSLWLVTTGKDANMNAHKIFGRTLHVINRNHLRYQVDGSIDFWNGLYSCIKDI